jgi:hypothetical protein
VISAVFRNTIIQLAVPDALRGRLSGLQIAVVAGGPRVGDLEAGAVAAAFGDTVSVVSGGLACIAGALALARLLPGFRQQRTPEPSGVSGASGASGASGQQGRVDGAGHLSEPAGSEVSSGEGTENGLAGAAAGNVKPGARRPVTRVPAVTAWPCQALGRTGTMGHRAGHNRDNGP